jgi:hypothetical protein
MRKKRTLPNMLHESCSGVTEFLTAAAYLHIILHRMLKYLASFLLLFASTAYAQHANWIGVHLGLNLLNEYFDSLPNGASTTLKLGPSIGIQFEHEFSDSWSLRTGLLFAQAGSNQSYDSSSSGQIDTQGHVLAGGADKLSLSYLEIPILAKLSFGDGDVRPYLYAGPAVQLLLSASEAADPNVTAISDLKSSTNSLAFALQFGAGISSLIGRGNTANFFDAGYSAGLTSVYKSNPRALSPNYIDLSTAKAGDIRVTVGMLWQL